MKRRELVHECVAQTHHGNDENVHTKRKTDDEYVEIGESCVFGKSIGNEVLFDDENEIDV